VFGASLVLGFYIGAYVRHGGTFRLDPSDPDYQGAQLEMNVKAEDDVATSNALRAYLSFLDQNASKVSPQFNSYFTADRALTLTRLAITMQRLGDDKRGHDYLERALALCGEMKWAQCDEEWLRKGAAAMTGDWSNPSNSRN
jgi:hypothetical protein